MPGNKKPRKKYRPRPPSIFDNPQKLSEAQKIALLTPIHSSAWSFTHGRATKDDWTQLANGLNMAVVAAELFYTESYYMDIQAAMLAHADAGQRFARIGVFGYTGEQLTAMNTAILIFQEQLNHTTVGEYLAIQQEIRLRFSQKHFTHLVKNG